MGLYSMTGYGTDTSVVDLVEVLSTVRSLNHRFLEMRARLPEPVVDITSAVEDVVRRKLERGRVELSVKINGAIGNGLALNETRARAAFVAFERLRDELCPGEAVPLSLLSAVPELFVPDTPLDPDALRQQVLRSVERACEALCEMRQREGNALERDLLSRLDELDRLTDVARKRMPIVLAAHRDRLAQRLARLIEDTTAALDPARLHQEVAILAERSDVEEELTRLSAHTAQFRHLLSTKTGPVGRKLDFLLQEMGREVNTLGAKSADAEIAWVVVELKAELERIREQTQNVL